MTETEAQCTGCPTPEKIHHATRQAAKNAIVGMYAHGRGNPDLQPYHCRCGCWHVGHSVVHFVQRIRKATRGDR